MDHMDIDSVIYVPDTPDRVVARDSKFKNTIEVPDSPDIEVVGVKVNSCNDKESIGMRANEEGIRKLCFRRPKSHHIHGSSSDSVPGDSSSKISFVTKRSDPSHSQSSNSLKIQNGISHVPREGIVERPTEQHCHGNKGENAVSLKGIQIIENGTRVVSDKGKKAVSSGKSQIVENGKNFESAAQLHSQQSVADSRLVSRINNGTGINPMVSAFDRGKGVESNAVNSPKVGQFVSASSSSPRKIRWVRNGCISPANIAKAQKDLGKGKNGTIDEESSHVSSSHTQAGAHSKAQASNVSNKGKGVIPLSNDESGGQNTNDRDAVTINEILGDDDLNGGWRRTHNRSKRTHPPSAECNLHPVDHTSTLSRGNNPIPRTQKLRPPFPARASSYDDSPPPLRQRLSLLDHRDMNRKSQQGSSSSTQDVRTQNTSDASGVVFLDSSGDNNTVASRPIRTRRRSNNLTRAIELDGASSSNSSVDPAMASQLLADEILALELQEQLYNEELGLRFGEIDVNERLDLQDEDVPPPPPRRTRQASTARTTSGNVRRQPRAQLNMNDSSDFRGHMSHRVRYRNSFPTRSRTLSSSDRDVSSLFPSEIDTGMMMAIMDSMRGMGGVSSSLLQTHRDFTESDYEQLLMLDENNHIHSGVSKRRINELPQTILENELEEACAVCLETPTTGDTIRHLPCFHKFHKDCIDPWLTRKSSCPVCKNSVT